MGIPVRGAVLPAALHIWVKLFDSWKAEFNLRDLRRRHSAVCSSLSCASAHNGEHLNKSSFLGIG